MIARHKTSVEIDTETVDAALDEVAAREAGRKLIEILDTPGMLELDNPEVMKGAWRRFS